MVYDVYHSYTNKLKMGIANYSGFYITQSVPALASGFGVPGLWSAVSGADHGKIPDIKVLWRGALTGSIRSIHCEPQTRCLKLQTHRSRL